MRIRGEGDAGNEAQYLIVHGDLEVPTFKIVVLFLGSLEPFWVEDLPFSHAVSSVMGRW
jgi:hypothetical protein